MGMDYVPRRREVEAFHVNWSGHEFLARSLDLLGADLATWSSLNEGDLVPASTCRSWAGLLSGALREDRIKLATVRGGGGQVGKIIPVVDGAATRGPGSLSADLELLDVAFGGERFTPQAPTRAIDASGRRLLAGFADFLAKCGGCRQW
jgi:hypothetical protein